MGKQWKQWQTFSKITADGDCSHEIKRHLFLGRKSMTNLDSLLKSRDITLLTKVCLVKAMVFPVVMYGYDSWTIKKAEHWRIDAFELWSWRRLLRVPWTARRSNQSILKEINLEYSLEGLMLKLKFQYWPPDGKNWLLGKDPEAGKDWRQEEKGSTEDEMVGWHHQIDGHESEQAPGVCDGQGSLACCNPWGHKESDTTEWLNWTHTYFHTLQCWHAKNRVKEETEIKTSIKRVRRGFPGGLVVKNPPANVGNAGLIHGSGGPPEEGNGNPLQYSCLGNPMEEPGGLQSMGLWKRQTCFRDKQQKLG